MLKNRNLILRDGDKSAAAAKYLFALVGVILCAFLAIAVINKYGNTGWQGDDFVEYYSAGALAGSPRLFDPQAIHSLQEQHRSGLFLLPFLRLPFYAWVLKPLAGLPYGAAHVIWILLSSLAGAMAIVLWPGGKIGDRAMAGGWFLPAAYCVVSGQDTLFFLLFAVIGTRLLTDRPAAAGLLFACCAFKYNLAIGPAVFLIGSRRWRVAIWAAAGVAAEVFASFGLQGFAWPVQYLSLLRTFDAALSPKGMPNLRGLASYLLGGLFLELGGSLLLLLLLWRSASGLSASAGMAAALAGGLLVSHHAYLYDSVLALPLVMEVYTRNAGGTKWLAIALLVPPLHILPWLFRPSDGWLLASQFIVVGILVVILVRVFKLAGATPGGPARVSRIEIA